MQCPLFLLEAGCLPVGENLPLVRTDRLFLNGTNVVNCTAMDIRFPLKKGEFRPIRS